MEQHVTNPWTIFGVLATCLDLQIVHSCATMREKEASRHDAEKQKTT